MTKSLLARWVSVKSILPKIAVIFGLVLSPSLSYGQAAFVHAAQGVWSSGSSYTCTLSYTGGNLAVVSVLLVASDLINDITGISDGVETYTQIDTFFAALNSSNVRVSTYYAKSVSGGSHTITVSLTSSVVTSAACIIHEYSGLDTTAPLDVHHINKQNNPGTVTDALTSTSVTTTANGEAIVGFSWTDRGGGMVLSSGTGFTQRQQINPQGVSEDKIQSSAGSIAAKFTANFSDAATDTISAIATFKAASGAATKHVIVGGGLF